MYYTRYVLRIEGWKFFYAALVILMGFLSQQTIKVCEAFPIVRSSFSRYTRCHNYLAPPELDPYTFRGNVTVLEEGVHHLVVYKPPSVVCHHSDWSGSRSSKKVPEVPMLQRTREAIQERVNLVHRLDRGASGCLLVTRAASEESSKATAILQEAMASPDTRKTYIALVRGEGILKERDFRKEGWFTIDRPIKDESGTLKNATTHFRFLAGQDNDRGLIDRPRASIVLARPDTGRWHQIRRHLNGLSHPILGDTTHGDNKVNRMWRNERNMLPERTCLHLLNIEIPPTDVSPDGIRVTSPIPLDMLTMLRDHLPTVWEEAKPELLAEGIDLVSKSATAKEIAVEFTVT